MKAVILARVSTKEQEDGHSLAAQKQRLAEYCQRRNLNVIKVFEIIESSTQGERKEFKEMLEFAEKQGETIAIVADAVDRVQRSFKESITLDSLIRKGALELHFYRENMVIGINASSSDILRWDFSVMGAKSYVLNLSENVKRSLSHKRENGGWNGPAPIGYINVIDTKTGKNTLAVDPARYTHIVRIFTDYSTGAFSINEMAKRAKEWGLRNKTKKAPPLSPSQVHYVLRNPFYYGQMRINKCLYNHIYDPLIDLSLFNRCQDIMKGRNRNSAVKQTKQEFIFRGILTCGISGRKVTPDIKKGKYVYLICRDPKNPEQKLFVPETKVLEQIKAVFQSISIPEPLADALRDHLKQSHEAEMSYHHHAIKKLERENADIQGMQDSLLDLLLAKSITQDTYDAKQQKFKQRQYEIHQELGSHHHADDSFKVTVSTLVSVASRAYELFMSSKNEQKRQLINFMFSNLQLKGAKLDYTLRTPFHLMQNVGGYENWLAVLHTIRTEYFKDIMAVQVLIPGIQHVIST